MVFLDFGSKTFSTVFESFTAASSGIACNGNDIHINDMQMCMASHHARM